MSLQITEVTVTKQYAFPFPGHFPLPDLLSLPELTCRSETKCPGVSTLLEGMPLEAVAMPWPVPGWGGGGT